MTVIDTSVIIAIINKEPDTPLYINYFKKSKKLYVSVLASVSETCIARFLRLFVSSTAHPWDAIQIVEFNNEQAYLAARAYQK